MKRKNGAVASSSVPSPSKSNSKSKPKPDADMDAPQDQERGRALISKAISDLYGEVPVTQGPLQVYTSSGRMVVSDAKSIVKCLSEISKKVGEVAAVRVVMNKHDMLEFLGAYKHNRPISTSNASKITRRFDTADYIRDFPTLMFDTDGLPCNGGHTGVGFVLSTLTTWEFVVLLGIDVRMGPRTDTNKGRDLIDQGYYVTHFAYTGIKGKKEQRTFTASVAYIFSMMVGTECLKTGLLPHEAKKEVIQHPIGQLLLERCNAPYVQIKKMLEATADEEKDRIYLSFKRVVFFVPALILSMAGYKDWPEKIAVADGLNKKDPLFKANKFLMSRSENRKGGPEMTTRREQSEILHAIYTILCYAYAADLKVPLRTPLARWEIGTDDDGNETEVFVYNTKYTKAEKTEDNKYKLEVARHFLSKIAPKLS